ncbi:hypothetical protein Btru_014669 [Bulinus truncatus]|nr:hypothetical protein Btru_014669 [Bulinus truncatus]
MVTLVIIGAASQPGKIPKVLVDSSILTHWNCDWDQISVCAIRDIWSCHGGEVPVMVCGGPVMLSCGPVMVCDVLSWWRRPVEVKVMDLLIVCEVLSWPISVSMWGHMSVTYTTDWYSTPGTVMLFIADHTKSLSIHGLHQHV